MAHIDISFVIPALNEEKCIVDTIASIYNFVSSEYHFEIIVVDNGSTDRTKHLAASAGATVYVEPDAKVGALRNLGVAHSTGQYLVFLDADVRLTKSWNQGINETFHMLEKNPNIVTGSKCGVSETPSFIEKYWFAPLLSKNSSYINSGHLITTRQLFDKLGGFSAELTSGEDYDFSIRAKKLGAKIINNQDLAVIHTGYPSTLKAFMLREMWHGIGDIQTFKKFISSKVAILSSLLMLSQIILLFSIVGGYSIVTFCSLFVLFAIPFISSCVKYKSENLKFILINSIIFYLYLMSRFFSFFVKAKKITSRSS